MSGSRTAKTFTATKVGGEKLEDTCSRGDSRRAYDPDIDRGESNKTGAN